MSEEAIKFLTRDKYLGPLIKKFGPIEIKPRKKAVYFEHLLSSITNQQLSGKAATTIFNRVKEKCDNKITPEKIKKLRTETLRKCGLSYAKCSYVKDLAERVMNNELRIRDLDKLSDEEVMKELIAVKGIGRWTAKMFLMFTLARPDVFPEEDLGIRNAFRLLVRKDLDPKEMKDFAGRWHPYRTTASLYLWKLLDS